MKSLGTETKKTTTTACQNTHTHTLDIVTEKGKRRRQDGEIGDRHTVYGQFKNTKIICPQPISL